MIHSEKIRENSDSLIELLAAQCVDLENLLALAREESVAAETGNFEGILEIVTKRAEIGSRLETSQRQISELRRQLNLSAAFPDESAAGKRIIEIANLTIAQDRKTKLLLTDARTDAANELANLEKSQRGTNAYLRGESKGLSYDGNF